MFLKNNVFKNLKDKYYVIMVQFIKLYYQNLLDISPKLLDKFPIIYTTQENGYFVPYMVNKGHKTKAQIKSFLIANNIPLPKYIYNVDMDSRSKSLSPFIITKFNKNIYKNM